MIRIAMLSGPRNISTTIMRSFENRPDTAVIDEPFYGWYLKTSGAPHPMRDKIMAAMACDWQTISQSLARAAGPHAIQFEKHISFHFAGAPDFDWLEGARVFHLIRDPRAMIASYRNKYDDVTPVIDSYRIQRRLYGLREAPVVDAADMLKAPAPMLRALCGALDIGFTEQMLSWPAGPRASDGPWAPHWYDAVRASTGFLPYREKSLDLTPELERAAEACQDDYRFFHARRISFDAEA